MSYIKYKHVVFDDLTYNNNSIQFSIFTDGIRKEYMIHLPRSWSGDLSVVVSLLPAILSVYALGYCTIARRVSVNFVIDSIDKDFIERIKMPFFSGLSGSSGHYLLSLPSIGTIEFMHVKEFSPFARNVLLPVAGKSGNKVAMGFSGGKESTLCHALYSKLHYDLRPLYVLKNMSAYPIFDGVPHLEFIAESKHPWDEVMDVIGMDHWYPSLSLIRLMYTAVHGVINGCFHIINGNEFNRTELSFSVSGAMNFGTNFGQSYFGMKFVQHYLYYKGIGHKVYSPVQNMSEILEEVILWKHFPDKAEKQVSCFTELPDETNRVVACGSCPKCVRMSAIVTALQKSHAYFGLPVDVGKEFCYGYDTNVKFGSTNASVEEQALHDLLEGNITPAVEEITQLRFDAIHPESNVPRDVIGLIKSLIQWKNTQQT